MKIGFIGLGLMGSAMCNRLLDLGYELNVIANRSRTNVDKLQDDLETAAGTISACASGQHLHQLIIMTISCLCGDSPATRGAAQTFSILFN